MIQIKQQLDPVFETYSLLYLAHQKKHYFHLIEKSLNTLGLQGNEVTKSKPFDILERYLDAFLKHQVAPQPASSFYKLKLKDEQSLIILLGFVSDISKAIESPDQPFCHFNETYVLEKLIPLFARISTTNLVEKKDSNFDTFLEYVMHASIDDSAKWLFVSLAKNPTEFFEDVVTSVRGNISAFEKATQQIKPELDILLQEFVSHLDEKKEERIYKSFNLFPDSNTIVYPTLSVCGALMNFHHFYHGLFFDRLMVGNDVLTSNKNDLLMKTKALSDKSKMEILLSLREKPKYSLELAEAMSLSPSTTSHHMNLLVLSGLVTTEKHGGKSYYHINEEGIQKLKGELDYFFAPKEL